MPVSKKLKTSGLYLRYTIAPFIAMMAFHDASYADSIDLDVSYRLYPVDHVVNTPIKKDRMFDKSLNKITNINFDLNKYNNYVGSGAEADKPLAPVQNQELPPSASGSDKSGEQFSDEATGKESYVDDLTLDNEQLRNEKKFNTNKKLEFVYQILNAIDTGETLTCLDDHRCHEYNPIIGHHPSDAKLIGFKAANGVLHYALYRYIRRDTESTKIFEYISVAVQGGAVIWNATICF